MVNKEHLNQNSEPVEETGVENSSETQKKSVKLIDSKERKRIQKLIQPSLLPNAVRVKAETLLFVETDQPEAVVPVAEDEPMPSIEEPAESEEEDEAELEFDFSGLNKLQLVELIEETVQDSDVLKIKNKVAAIKVNFLRLNKQDIEREMEQFINDGGERESYTHSDDPLEVRFKAAFNVFKENKAKYNEALDRQKEENLAQKKEILEKLRVLIESEETLKETYDNFRALQDQWKAVGQVPQTEVSNLWNNYHFLVEKFFDKVKINRELRDLDLKKNLEAKIELCEKVEELFLEKSVTKSFKLLQKYHEEWKEIGPVIASKKDEIWDRFKSATDKINEIRREHYSKLQAEQEANYEAKLALCVKAEEIAAEQIGSMGAWQKKSAEMSDLLKVWKSTGAVPKKRSDEVWTRFKSAMDSFFNSKKEFFSTMKDQQIENYNRKIQLCVEAEALAETKNWRKGTEEIKRLQEEWKTVGPVPKRHSDKIWKRFRAACDNFFNLKNEFFTSLKGQETDNLAKKKALIEEIKNYEIKKNRAENLEAVKAFQRAWVEIGFVSGKQKDAIQNEYRKAVDAIFDKMKINENELSTSEYRDMISGIKDDYRLKAERTNLTNRIAKLREEIQVLENNIGFFSFSKQSELLKAEYQKKIDAAKNNLKVLEAKLKILNEQ